MDFETMLTEAQALFDQEKFQEGSDLLQSWVHENPQEFQREMKNKRWFKFCAVNGRFAEWCTGKL